jgi:RHS repeat-associated protein
MFLIAMALLIMPKVSTPQSSSSITLPGQTATLLPDGRRLLVGGETLAGVVATSSIWNPRTDTTVQLSARLQQARAWHTATTLPDGSILIFGGVGVDGRVIQTAELFYPDTQSFSFFPVDGVAARTRHSATLMTDGRVLFAGGVSAEDQTLAVADLWNSNDGSVVTLPLLSVARRNHVSTLLPDGRVLLWAGVSSSGETANSGELFDQLALRFTPVDAYPSSAFSLPTDAPSLVASLPPDQVVNVPSDAVIALRFSKPLRVETVNTDTVTLNGPKGIERVRVVPAEDGMLAFVVPEVLLIQGANYLVTINGPVDNDGFRMPLTGFSFSTRVLGASVSVNPIPLQESGIQVFSGGLPELTRQNVIPHEDWEWKGMWKNGRPYSPWQDFPALQADSGVTAVAGQVLDLRGLPLANVKLKIENHYGRGEISAATDDTGRFLLKGITPGEGELVIDGRHARRRPSGQSSATGVETNHGVFEYGLEIVKEKTNTLPFTIWLPKIDTAHAVKIQSPTVNELVVTTPHIPHLEAHLPQGVVIKDHEGSTVNEISITPIPVDRPPFPLPREVNPPVYFTIQPGGAYVYGDQGVRLIYPNYAVYPRPAGTRLDFWHYDPGYKGWYIYGQGTVTEDGRQVMPDPGISIREFTGAMIGRTPPPPKRTCGNDDNNHGDPVDLCNGLFFYTKTDLVVPDVIPLVLTRTYNQNDSEPNNRDFGLGATHPYNIYLYSINNYQDADLILPDGARIHYVRTSAGTDFTNAVYEHTATPSRYYKSKLAWNGSLGSKWIITLKDGTKYHFAESCTSCQAATLLAIEDRNGNKVQIERMFVNAFSDPAGPITQITSPSGRWIKFEYDLTNPVTSYIITKAWDSLNRTVNYTYDTTGRLKTATDPTGGVWEYTYDGSHRMLTVKDPRLITVVTNEYDANGRVLRQTLPGGEFHTFAYTTDGSGNITQSDVTDAQGDTRRITFNSEGYTQSDTRSFGTASAQTISHQREAGTNFATSVTDTLGRRSDFVRDTMGNVTSVTSAANIPGESVTINFVFDASNRLTSVTDALNHATSFGYDAKGNMTTVTNSLGHATTFTYDSAGRRQTVTDPMGKTTQFSYDSVGDLVSVTSPSGDVGTQFLDAAGRVVTATSPSGSVTRFDYDLLNRVSRITDSNAGQTNFLYDTTGNLLSFTDAKSQTNSFTYDNEGRLATRTDPLLRQETHQYDSRGRLTQFTDRNTQPITHAYDTHNRRTQTTYADLSTTTFTYDTANRVSQIADTIGGLITRTYDNHDRLTSETTPQGSIAYIYDAVGRRSSMTVTGQPAVNYTYDNANRLTQITQGAAIVAFAYDIAGRRTSVTLPSGNVMEYSYDLSSRITEIKYKRGTTIIGNITYEHDKDGKRTKTGGSYGRTGIPQAVSSTTYNVNNQQTVFGNKTHTYDNNGNLLSATDSGGTTNYTWNARNLLTGISGPGVSATFVYDAVGRRVRKTVNGVTTEFLYDGINPVQELSGGSVVANILTGVGMDERFTRTDSAGTRNMLTDVLGSVIALADSAGTIQTEYTYDAFGKMTFTGQSNSNPYQYTGRENDGTGLYYYRARYYHPELQRFVSEDPIGLSGSGVNFYPYVNNSAINFNDPLGLFDKVNHYMLSRNAAIDAGCSKLAPELGILTANVDFKPNSQLTDNAHWHGMCSPENANDPGKGKQIIDNYIQSKLQTCKLSDLADALHAAQDSFAPGHHGCQPWYGMAKSINLTGLAHFILDIHPTAASLAAAQSVSRGIMDDFVKRCPCVCQ